MRPLKMNREEVSRGDPMGKNSLVPAVQELWNAWEIHFLILLSLSLQVFLFLFAGMRRRSSSRVLSIVLWLAYLSADSVAIFVLGHLAVRAGEPGHQLMSFWAPFVLIHLGGQDTITAFSRQDNELWLRHLLNLVTQVVVAGYVVAKASWPDSRLRVAMVLMFLSGCFKYAERTLCLYSASPARLRSHNIGIMSRKLQAFQWFLKKDNDSRVVADNDLTPRHIFDYMMKEATSESSSSTDIMSVDAPINETEIIIKYLDKLPDTHKEFLSNPDRYDPYKFVGACLLDWYEGLYTKNPFRQSFFEIYQECLYPFFRECFRDCLYGCLRSCLGEIRDFLRDIFRDCGLPSCSVELLTLLRVVFESSSCLVFLSSSYPCCYYTLCSNMSQP
ncbi:uncharacterized protein LOC120639616 [Panicum virgatum]|uniref:uncharacterized protein LOC120639616 n=1 Tax=Panicum virgatum TaxID=38727 RepID=UPI0019D60F07|nr:uncharacterized protein LOC120639616 [Panicum virgatum]